MTFAVLSRCTGVSPRRRAALLAVAACVLTAVPAQSAEVAEPPVDFYGTWYDALSHTAEENDAALDAQSALGLGAVRQYVFWDRVERTPGSYDWAKTDEVVGDLTARGTAIVPTLLYAPAFHSTKPASETGTAQYPPRDPATLAAFARAMVERYGPGGDFWCRPPAALRDVVPAELTEPLQSALPCDDSRALRTWEVWNEPDHKGWWGRKPDARQYAEMLRVVSAAIKQADPGAEVVLGALTGEGASGGYLESLYQLGVGDAFDTIAFNPYAKSTRDVVARIRAVRAVAARNGDADKPFRILEYGWATGGRSKTTVVSHSCQGALLHATTRRLAELREELGLRSIVQFQWQDPAVQGSAWPNFAGLHEPDGTTKPGAFGLGAAISGRSAPAGLGLAACPTDRQAV